MESVLVYLHVWLSSLAQTVAKPVVDLALHLNVFGVTAFLLGIVGATAPCQLTSNSSAIALVTSSIDRKSAWSRTAFFVLGKAVVYVALGTTAILIGTTIEDIPFFGNNLFQMVLGPTLMIVGFVLLGLIPVRMNFLSVVHEKAKNWISLKNSALGLG
ncbi:sulfite exporter TauE/SafE family protein [Effusibacillus consociatus]|uniref:Sulfite exporter TauE/SafE family protein n=1 Tax=Effusibacillus consociatus TaxID=1117041 RepID=A0ABV9Q533_9BACL